MKDEIKQFIIDNNILYPTFNRNIARKIYWNNRNKEWAEYIFTNYEEHNKKRSINFANFLRYFFFGEKIKYYYNNVEEYLTKTVNLQCNPGTKLYNSFYNEAINFVKFEPINMTEIIYCYRNNLKERPKCLECDNDVKFTVYKTGYRKFCSQQCQLIYNNKLKEIKRSNKSDKEIREIISNIPLDLRNLTNIEIANNFENIIERTKDFHDIPTNERIHIFQNNLSISDITCVCGSKRLFKSQGVGYLKTCGKSLCMNISKNVNFFNNNEINIRTSKSGTSYKNGFLYVLKSDDNGFFKIGISQNPINRLESLRKNISDFRIIECFWLNSDLGNIESYLHKKFNNKKVYFDTSFDGFSEIFYLDDADITYIKDYIYEIKQ